MHTRNSRRYSPSHEHITNDANSDVAPAFPATTTERRGTSPHNLGGSIETTTRTQVMVEEPSENYSSTEWSARLRRAVSEPPPLVLDTAADVDDKFDVDRSKDSISTVLVHSVAIQSVATFATIAMIIFTLGLVTAPAPVEFDGRSAPSCTTKQLKQLLNLQQPDNGGVYWSNSDAVDFNAPRCNFRPPPAAAASTNPSSRACWYNEDSKNITTCDADPNATSTLDVDHIALLRYALFSVTMREATSNDHCVSYGSEPANMAVWITISLVLLIVVAATLVMPRRSARATEWLVDDLLDKADDEITKVCTLVGMTIQEFEFLTEGSSHQRGNGSSDQPESGSPSASYNGSRRQSRANLSMSVASRDQRRTVEVSPRGKPAREHEKEDTTQEAATFNTAIESLRGLNERFAATMVHFSNLNGRETSASKSPRLHWRPKIASPYDESSSPRRRTLMISDSDNFSDSQSSVDVIPPPVVRSGATGGGVVSSLALRRTSVNFSPTPSASRRKSHNGFNRGMGNPHDGDSADHPFGMPQSTTHHSDRYGSPQIAIVQSDSDSEPSCSPPQKQLLGGTMGPENEDDLGEDSLQNTVASVENNAAWHRGFAMFAPLLDSITQDGLRPSRTPGGANNNMFLSVDHVFGSSQTGGAAGNSTLSSPAESAIIVAKRRVSRVSEVLLNVNRSRRNSRMPTITDEGSESPQAIKASPEDAFQRVSSAMKSTLLAPANTPQSNTTTNGSAPLSPWNEAIVVQRLADVLTFDLRKRQGTFLFFGIDELFAEEPSTPSMYLNGIFPEKRFEADYTLGRISPQALLSREFLSQTCLAVAITTIRTFEGVITNVTANSVTASWNTVRPYPFSDTRATTCAQYLASAIDDLFAHLESGDTHNSSSSMFATSGDQIDDNGSVGEKIVKVGSLSFSASMGSPKALRRLASLQPAVKAALDKAVVPHKISPLMQRMVAAMFRDKWAISLTSGPAYVGVSGTMSTMNTSHVSDALSGLTRLWRLAVHIRARVLLSDVLVSGARSHSYVVPVDVISTNASDVRMVFEMRQPNEVVALREQYTNFTLAVTQFAAGNFLTAVQMLNEYCQSAPNGRVDPQAQRLLAAATFFADAADQDSDTEKEPGRMASFPRLSSLLRQHSSQMSGMIAARRLAGRDSRGYLRCLPGWMSHEAEAEWLLQRPASTAAPDSTPSTPLVTTRTQPRQDTPVVELLSTRLREQITTRHRSNSRESNVAIHAPGSSLASSSDDDAATENDWQTGSTRGAPAGAAYLDDQGRVWRCSERVLGEGAYGKVFLGMSQLGELIAVKVVPIPAHVDGGAGGDVESSIPSPVTLALSISERNPAWRADSFTKETSTSETTAESSHEKQVTHAAIDALITEISTMSAIRHANIVSYHATIVTPISLVIVTEYVPGGSLSQLLQRFGPLPVAAIQTFLRSVLNGLAVLHRRGIVHCDISTSNILVGNDGACKLADFGCSWRIGSLTKAAVSGTPAFMAPESCAGSPCKASDVWGVGVVALYLSTGQLPYTAAFIETPEALVSRVGEMASRIGALTEDDVNFFRAIELPAAHCRMMNDPASIICKANPLFKPSSRTALRFVEIAGTDPASKVPEEDMGKLLVLSFARTCLMLDPQARPTVEQLNSHGLFLHC